MTLVRCKVVLAHPPMEETFQSLQKAIDAIINRAWWQGRPPSRFRSQFWDFRLLVTPSKEGFQSDVPLDAIEGW